MEQEEQPEAAEPAPEPVRELTNAEKIEALKVQLSEGTMGPAQFDQEFQKLWGARSGNQQRQVSVRVVQGGDSNTWD